MILDKKQIFSWLANLEEREAEVCLDAIIAWSLNVQGSWNGDEAGVEEDRAMQAQEIEGKAKELLELIQNM